ncbi:cobalt-precorrin 5A hydrolase [Mycoplasma sp. P36-A1]|uniref:cobalt-precorrin 5A hydrolase n=1 Tax=Mycoplasma sp. P36-A1 TaxID=3252900 RepID=UPI003C2CA75F
MKTNAYIISFTNEGQQISQEIIQKSDFLTTNYDKTTNLDNFIKKGFEQANLIIFISATGIAIRKVAKYLNGKANDPAIIVIDNNKQFVISLLSGHIGQANQYTKQLATILKATPVITTATDTQNIFAIDNFAVFNHLYIKDKSKIKKISSTLLNKEKINIISEIPINNLDNTIIDAESAVKIIITKNQNLSAKENECILIPKEYIIGIGVRKDKPFFEIEKYFLKTLKENNININQIKALTTIDLKDKEEGLWQLIRKYNLLFETYSAQTLNKVKGDFPSSDFVKKITATDNVCERSIKAFDNNASILLHKQKHDGMTIAIGKSEIKILEM